MTDAIDRGRSQAGLPYDRCGEVLDARCGASASASHGLSGEGRFAEALRIAEQTAGKRRTDASLITPAELAGPHAYHDVEQQNEIAGDCRLKGIPSGERHDSERLDASLPTAGSVITRAFQARYRSEQEQLPLIAGLAALVRTDAMLLPGPAASTTAGLADRPLEQAVKIVREFAEHLELAHDHSGNVSEIRFRLPESRFGPVSVTCRIEDGELVVLVVTETQISPEVIERLTHELRLALSRIFANPRIKMGNPTAGRADTLDIRKSARNRSDEKK
ncbi:MAG: hypothetical protein ABGZ17_18605 [Planctomycetaceae bacterium]